MQRNSVKVLSSHSMPVPVLHKLPLKYASNLTFMRVSKCQDKNQDFFRTSQDLCCQNIKTILVPFWALLHHEQMLTIMNTHFHEQTRIKKTIPRHFYLQRLSYDTNNMCITTNVLAKLIFQDHTNQKSDLFRDQ